MKIFILTNDDLTSNLIFSHLFEIKNINIVGCAYTTTLTSKKNKNILSEVYGVFKKTDWRYWIYLIITNLIFKVYELLLFLFDSGNLNKIYSIKKICKKKQIPVYYSDDFNSVDFIKIINYHKPDLIVIRINQILKEDILKIPEYGFWCVHSSLLPSYKGIATEFHAMLNDEEIIGTTIFQVELELDKGKSLFTSQFQIDKGNSLFYNMLKNNFSGGRLLAKSIEDFACNRNIKDFSQKCRESYFSWPKKEQVDKFLKNKKQLVTFREIVRYLYLVIKRELHQLSD